VSTRQQGGRAGFACSSDRFDQRTALLKKAPDVYHVTDHYVSHLIVLVRMSRINPDALALRDLLKAGWRFVTAGKDKPSVSRRSVQRSNRKER